MAQTSREVRLPSEGGRNRDEFRAIDHGVHIVTEDGQLEHRCLERTLELSLVVCTSHKQDGHISD